MSWISKCVFCHTECKGGWFLKKYHGFSGYTCVGCYDKISHDAHGNPEQPEEYLLMVLKHLCVKEA